MRARLQTLSVRRVVAVIALAFFFAPIALRAAGMTARPFENRPMAIFPKLSQGWDGLEQGKRFFVDRMPLREQAVRADSWISTEIFDISPSAGRAGTQAPAGLPAKAAQKPADAAPAVAVDKAIAGKAGWLFLEGELNRACSPFISWQEAMRRWQRMAAIIRRSGRRVVLFFPPDKSTIHPEYLPDSFAQRTCLAPGRRAARKAIEGATDPAVLALRRTMLAAKRPGTASPYHRQDTHWNTMGGTIAVGALLERLAGRVRLRQSEIVKERVRYQGDLTVLAGDPQFDVTPSWTIRRGAGAPVVEGRALFVLDSFGTAMRGAVRAYWRSPTFMLWYDTPADELIAAIGRADTVVLETVERELNFRASDLGLLTPKFLNALERGLPRR